MFIIILTLGPSYELVRCLATIDSVGESLCSQVPLALIHTRQFMVKTEKIAVKNGSY